MEISIQAFPVVSDLLEGNIVCGIAEFAVFVHFKMQMAGIHGFIKGRFSHGTDLLSLGYRIPGFGEGRSI